MADISTEQELRSILDANNLPELVENWSASYDKRADMFVAGNNFPDGSYYFPIEDTGVMLRIDDHKKIYGFAIENTKLFLKENPQFDLLLSFFVSPLKFYFVYLPSLFITYQAIRAVRGMIKMKGLVTISDYIAGRAVYAS